MLDLEHYQLAEVMMKAQLRCKCHNLGLEDSSINHYRKLVVRYFKMQVLQFLIKGHSRCSQQLHKDKIPMVIVEFNTQTGL